MVGIGQEVVVVVCRHGPLNLEIRVLTPPGAWCAFTWMRPITPSGGAGCRTAAKVGRTMAADTHGVPPSPSPSTRGALLLPWSLFILGGAMPCPAPTRFDLTYNTSPGDSHVSRS